jgi:branched-chain amino acid transport system permease protein
MRSSRRGLEIRAMILGLNEVITSVTRGGQSVFIPQFMRIIAILLVRPRGIAGILDRAREA